MICRFPPRSEISIDNSRERKAEVQHIREIIPDVLAQYLLRDRRTLPDLLGASRERLERKLVRVGCPS